MRDLMPAGDASRIAARIRRQPTQNDIRAALVDEEQRHRIDHAISDGERLVAADIDAIRHAVAVRLGVHLPPVQRVAADSHAGGHERDPLWPVLLERGWRNAWISAYGTEPCCAIEDFASHGVVGVDLLQAAESAATAELHWCVSRRAPRRVA